MSTNTTETGAGSETTALERAKAKYDHWSYTGKVLHNLFVAFTNDELIAWANAGFKVRGVVISPMGSELCTRLAALTAELTQLRAERDALARDYERIHDCGADVASALGVAMSYDAFANMPQAERTRCANAIDRFAAAEHFINAARDGATASEHDEQCDTRDLFIKNKPCNCKRRDGATGEQQ